MLARGRLRRPPRPQGAASSSTRATTSSSSTCARATSPPTSAPARSTSASPAATCCSTSGSPARRRSRRSTSATSTFRFAGPAGALQRRSPTSTGVRVATSYPGLVGAFLDEHGVAVDLVPLDGAVESAVRLGVADAVADVVETGTTLRKRASRSSARCILESEAVLIAGAERRRGAETLLRRLQGVHGRPPVRADRLRPAGRACSTRPSRSPRASSRRPSRRCATPSGWPCASWCPRERHQPRHGRAVRARRPRDPGHRRSTPRGI